MKKFLVLAVVIAVLALIAVGFLSVRAPVSGSSPELFSFPRETIPAGLTYVGYSNTTDLSLKGAQKGVIVTYRGSRGDTILEIGEYGSEGEAGRAFNNLLEFLQENGMTVKNDEVQGRKVKVFEGTVEDFRIYGILWTEGKLVYYLVTPDLKTAKKLVEMIP